MLGRVGTTAREENTAAAVGSGSDKKGGVAAAASGPVKQQQPAPAAAVLPRQPLRPAAGISANISRSSSSSVQDRLETSTIEKGSAAPTPRGGAAWEISVEAFTPARQRPQQPPLTTPRRELSFMGGSQPPSTAAKAAAKGGSSNAQAGVSAPSARQEKVLCEWLNHTLLPRGPAEALPHPAVFLKVNVVGSASYARCKQQRHVQKNN